MGFSPGEFVSRGESFHWEGKGKPAIVLWNADESKILLWLTPEEARKASDQLALLADMAEEDRL